MAAFNALAGLVIAWVLVRDDFRGKQVVNAVIDLPFALPTIVAGLTLLTLYGPNSPFHLNVADTRWGILFALAFVTLPFSVRSVQPVLAELDRETEEAAASLGASSGRVLWRIILPSLAPAMLAGAGLAFARAIGRVRLGGADLGQRPVQDRGVLVVDLQPVPERSTGCGGGRVGGAGGHRPRCPVGASASSGGGSTSARPYEAGGDVSGRWRWPLRIMALGYLGFLVVIPVGSIFYRAFQHGFAAGLGRRDHARRPPRPVADLPGGPHRRAPGHRLRRGGGPHPGPPPVPGSLAPRRLRRPAPGRLAGGGGHRPHPRLRQDRVVRQLAGRPRHHTSSSRCPGIVMASATVALPYVVREVLPVLQEIGTDQEQAATTLGASPFTVFRRITLPSIRRSLAYGVTLTTARVHR